eukprot:TRINITY_DN795_c0_g1_i7.p2 TRINITY_DN795_c0_g1~~TRINITY_DN795_c0_g1_i7.p2  ORF type:complete len:221 (-),score=-0.12 TRINITY_DN795_c0_g1_i7:73-735(-)
MNNVIIIRSIGQQTKCNALQNIDYCSGYIQSIDKEYFTQLRLLYIFENTKYQFSIQNMYIYIYIFQPILLILLSLWCNSSFFVVFYDFCLCPLFKIYLAWLAQRLIWVFKLQFMDQGFRRYLYSVVVGVKIFVLLYFEYISSGQGMNVSSIGRVCFQNFGSTGESMIVMLHCSRKSKWCYGVKQLGELKLWFDILSLIVLKENDPLKLFRIAPYQQGSYL